MTAGAEAVRAVRAATDEVQGMTSRWVDDHGGLAGLGLALLRVRGCIAIATSQAVDGSLVGACCAAMPALSDAGAPALVWALAPEAPGLAVFNHCSHVALNLIDANDDAGHALAQRFSGERCDRFTALAFEFGLGGAPLLERALATFECENRPQLLADASGHWPFTGLVRRYRLADAG